MILGSLKEIHGKKERGGKNKLSGKITKKATGNSRLARLGFLALI